MVRTHVAMRIPQAMCGVHLHVRKCRCSPVLDISGTAGRIALKFGVVKDQLAMRFTLLRDGVHLQVRTGCICMCTRAHPFSVSISGTTRRIALKFGVFLETN